MKHETKFALMRIYSSAVNSIGSLDDDMQDQVDLMALKIAKQKHNKLADELGYERIP